MKKLRFPYSRLTTRFKYWSLMVLASAIVVGFGFVAGWQNYRQNANDPQVQYVQDIVAALEQGATPEAFGGGSTIDPRKSLGLFLIVTDDKKKPTASTMQLDGKDSPVPSDKTFNAANKTQQRFLWKPAKDAKVAVVMQHYKGGYVLVGRSVKEVDARIKDLGLLALGAFLALVAVSTLAVRVGTSNGKPKQKSVTPMEALTFEAEAPAVGSTKEEKTVVAKEAPAKESSAKPKFHKKKKSAKKS